MIPNWVFLKTTVQLSILCSSYAKLGKCQFRTERLWRKAFGRQTRNCANLRVVVSGLGMEGVVIVITMQTRQGKSAACAKQIPHTIQVVYAENAANKAQVNGRRFGVQHVEFGNLLGAVGGAKIALVVNFSGTKKVIRRQRRQRRR